MYLISPISCLYVTRATRSGWWMTGKAFATFNTWSFVGIFSDYMWRLKTLKNPYHLQKVKFKLSKKRKKTSLRKKNRELRIQWLWLRHFSRLRTKIDNWKICHKPIWPFTWKISSVGKDKVNEWEFCELKITPIAVFVIMIQRIFPSFFLCDVYSGIVISLFLFFNKVGFYCQ